MMKIVSVSGLLLAACASGPDPAPTEVTAASAAPPAWWGAHVEFITRDGGTWVSPIAAATADPAGPDAYAMRWQSAHGGHVLVGRLYGLRGGQEVAEYWTFREFWHPGERRAIALQWGGAGMHGAGESRWESGEVVLEQTFWLPDGRSWREGHRNHESGDEYATQTFDIDAQGRWLPKPVRSWTRVRRPAEDHPR
ncbi:MAG: hypothetical protein IPK26_03260 [Planctomycetes bacterium]|nr:hypothetical protein [Planctomycetota bacterium]